MPPLIEVQNLVKYFPVSKGFLGRQVEHVRAVDSVDFSVEAGETLGLVGESGCGKTTVGHLLLGLLQPDRGRVLYKGKDMAALSGRERKAMRKSIQAVFQDPQSSLDPRMLIKKTVGYPLEVNRMARGAELVRRVEKMLGEVGLQKEHMYRYPHEFSGGQKQRISIARALITEPELIVLDEPTSALDVSVQAQILNLIKELQRRYGYSYLFISHDLSVVNHISHRIGVMYLGKIVETAGRKDLFRNPLHPYTRILLNSVPLPDPCRRQLDVLLQGDVPSPVNIPTGCRFHPRCPEAMQRCSEEAPAVIEAARDHWVTCHLYS